MTRQPKPLSPEVRQKISGDPDYIALGHHKNSLKVARSKYPDGLPDHIVAKALGLTVAQLKAMWASTVRQLRKIMKVEKSE